MLSILLALLFIGASGWLGFEVIFFLTQGRLHLLEIFSISFPIGMVIVSISSSFLNLFLFCTGVHFTAQLILSVIISIILNKFNRKYKSDYSNFPKLSLFGVIMWSIIFSSLATFIFPTSDKIIRSGENDMLLEISMISSFTKGVNKKSNMLSGFQINILKGLTTRTEILPFLYCSLIKSIGCSLRLSIILPTIFLFISICFLSFSYIYRITHDHLIAFFAPPVMLLIAGLGFTHFINNNDRGNSAADFVFFYGSGVVNWGHPLVHNLLTSRINLLSLSLSLTVYLFLEADFYHLAGIVSIISFFVRPQSGFILFIAFFLYNIDISGLKCSKNHHLKSNNTIYNRLKFYSIPFLILSFLFLKKFSIEFKNPLWKSDISKDSFLPFLAFPFHAYGFGFLSLIFTFLQSPHRAILPIGLFYFLSIVSLQNDHRFNFFTTQTVVTPLIVAAICSGFSTLISLCSNPQLKGIVITSISFLFILMCLSSLCGIYNQINQSIKIFGENENDAAKWIDKNTKRKSVFAMPQKLNWNPAFARAGRVGYIGNIQALQDYIVNNSHYFTTLAKFVDNPDHKIDVDYFIMKKEKDNWNKNLLNSKILNIVFNNSMFVIMSWKPLQD